MIRFENVTKQFAAAEEPAVKNLNMEVPEGYITVLVGPSGCGKTTTMKMVNRIYEPTEGKIFVNDQDTSHVDTIELRLDIGYVIQEIGLFPHMTIADNVATVLYEKKWPKNKIVERVNELLELMGLDPETYRDRKPSLLSGGQRQRVGVARAMAANPPIMLMDEPFAAVDPITRERLQNEFLELQEKMNKTIIFVTHDINEAIKMGDRIAVMKDGHIVQFDAPTKLLRNPADEFVMDLVGSNRAVKSLSLIQCQKIVKNDVIVVDKDAEVDQVKERIDKSEFNLALVTDENNQLLGYVSNVDLADSYSKIGELVRPHGTFMSGCNNLSEAISVMLEEGTYHVPIVSEQNVPEGIISIDDIFKAVS